jgi:hypothetical protein
MTKPCVNCKRQTTVRLSGRCPACSRRLIAAAPDLLEALKGVLRVADRATDEFDAARAAVVKAESTQEE